MNTQILGLGLAVPGEPVPQGMTAAAALALGAGTHIDPERVRKLYEHAGIQTRHTLHPGSFFKALLTGASDCTWPFLPDPDSPQGPTTQARLKLYAAAASPLAIQAAQRALADAATIPAAITHLVLVSCTGFVAPGVDQALIQALGLPLSVERVQVGFQGCHGGVNGLRTADALARAHAGSVVLLVCVELCTLHHVYQPTLEETIANALFADGAAALVLRAAAPLPETEPVPQGGCHWFVGGTASVVLPGTADAMTWTIGDYGFRMTLNRAVGPAIQEAIAPWLDQLQQSGKFPGPPRELAWAIHPGGPRILEAALAGLQLPREAATASYQVLARYGNMSSATVWFVWDRLRRQPAGSARPAVLLAFGPGLTAELAWLTPRLV